MSRIIVSWCDGTWKSFLVKYLQRKLWRPSVHFSYPITDDPFEELIKYYRFWDPHYITSELIFDRSRICELIYWQVLGRKPFTEDQTNEFISYCSNDVIIITYTDIKNILNVFKDRGEDYIDENQAKKINEMYLDFAEKYKKKLKIFIYDWTIDGKQKDLFFKKIQEC